QVFLSVTSVLNMAVFKDHFVLEDLVEEMQKQSTALSFGPLQPNGRIAVRGSFPALSMLRDFLWLKARSLSEKDKREESKSYQRPRRRPQEHRGGTEKRNSVHSVRDAGGGKQEVVLDTDTYHYMRHFSPRTFQVNDVVISASTDGGITTVCIEEAGRKADAAHVSRVKRLIENCSIKLHKTLRKERICFQEQSRAEKQRYKRLCEGLKPRYPGVLIIPYDTHIDVIGTSSDIYEFTKEVRG
ncbi:RBM43 protein, partial [Atrichornis clamosus]|nr:RBM43 protein [Atrichornis clamosus]